MERYLNFISADIVAIELSVGIIHLFTQAFFPNYTYNEKLLALLLPLIHLILTIMINNYEGVLYRGYLKEFSSLLRLEIFSFALLLFFLYFLKMDTDSSRKVLLGLFFINFVFTYCLRFACKYYLHHRYKNVKHTRQVMIVCSRSFAEHIIGQLNQPVLHSYQFYGLVVIDRSMIGQTIQGVPVVADKDSYIDYIKANIVDEILIGFPESPESILSIANQLLDMGIIVHIYMGSEYQALPNRRISNVFGCNVLTSSISPISSKQALLKRSLDIIGGVAGCLLCIVIGILIGPVIFLRSPGNIIFSQTRVGQNGRSFKFYKFRSMYLDAEKRKQELMSQNKISDGMMFKLENDPRIIKGIGHFMRKTSLDEFPQFWNVLKGDMSLVGTRPPTLDEFKKYMPHHKRRLSTKPGITGLWQVSGRSNITDFEKVIQLDTQYIENWSLSLDIKILFQTLLQLFRQDGSM